jgi:predicted MFS family arabinose efflux permease
VYYTASFVRDIRGASTPLHISAQMSPLPPVGVVAALSLIWIFPRFEGHWILGGALTSFFVGNLLMATAPRHQSWWANVFVSQLIETFGSDWSFASGSLIIANSVPQNVQGTASGLVQVIVNYSIALGLGMAGTIEAYVNDGGQDLLRGYHGAFYFATCVSFVGLLLVLAFVRTRSKEQAGK